MKSRRDLLTAASLAPMAAMLPSLAAAADAKVQLMFVQSAEGLKADDKTLRLVNVSSQAIWFSDRPVRQAGHMSHEGLHEGMDGRRGAEQLQQGPAERHAVGVSARQGREHADRGRDQRAQGRGQGPGLHATS